MVGLYLLLFFAGKTTRKLAVALLPFALFGISYDWMRVFPNYEANSIDVENLYNQKKSLFGINDNGNILIPCEYFAIHNCRIADILAGIFYLCWVPVPIAFGLWLYLKGYRNLYLHFSMVFLFVNLIGFAGYYLHPAAPPWYAINYGFEPILDTPGNVAGVVVLSSSSELSAETVDFRTPKCGNAAIDDAVSSAVRDGAFRAVHEMEWTDPGEMERKAVEAEYTTLLAGWNAPERVKKLALELFRNSALQHFKSGQV